jgi:hypothetical protein
MPRRSPQYGGGGSPGASPPVNIPSHNLDPVWSLKPWPAELHLDGETWEFPAAAAVEWLSVLMQEEPDLDQVLMDMCPRGLELLFRDTVEPEVLYRGVLELIEVVAARRWWITLRLISVVRANWHVLGPEMITSGVDPQVLSLAAWLDAMTVLVIQAMDPKEVGLFVSRLELPPPSEVAAEMDRVEEFTMSREQFLSMR